MVKRRLAGEVGAEAALAAHVELVEGTLSRCAEEIRDCELWIHGDPQAQLVAAWAERFRVRVRRQAGADLGERMAGALAQALDAGHHGVLIGCDCPDIDAAYIRKAFATLESVDLVIGPAQDGGYGLIGLSRSVPGLFTDMPWGSATVLRETLSRASAAGARVRLLEEIYDVDTAADWRRYRSLRPDR